MVGAAASRLPSSESEDKRFLQKGTTQRRLRSAYPNDKKLAMLVATGVQAATMASCISASDRRLGD